MTERKYALYNKNTGRLVGLKKGLEITAVEACAINGTNTLSRSIGNEEYARLRVEQTKRLWRNSPNYN